MKSQTDKDITKSGANYTIKCTISNGDLTWLKELFKDQQFDPRAEDNYAIRFAASNGHVEMVKFLLKDPRVSPGALDNYAIQHAAAKGKIEVVKVLLMDPRVNPIACGNSALNLASERRHQNVVAELLKDPRVKIKQAMNQPGFMPDAEAMYPHFHLEPSFNKIYAELKIEEESYRSEKEKSKRVMSDYSKIKEAESKAKGILAKRDRELDRLRYSMRVAVEAGDISAVKEYLLNPRTSPGDCCIRAIELAAAKGKIEVAKILLKDLRVEPDANRNAAIRYASAFGHLEMVILLLSEPRVCPEDLSNEAIQRASENGHKEVVKALLADPRVSPEAVNNQALKNAISEGHTEVMEVLLMDPRVKELFDLENASIQSKANEYQPSNLLSDSSRFTFYGTQEADQIEEIISDLTQKSSA